MQPILKHKFSALPVPVGGMTLIEILAVVVILGLVAGTLLVGFSGSFGKAKHELAKSGIAVVVGQLEKYRLEKGQWPSNDYGLWWGYDNVLSGRPYEERVFNSSDQIVQRTITTWDLAESDVLMTRIPERRVQFNPRTTWTQTITYDGNNGVAAATKLEYHDGYDEPGSPLNVRYKKEYGYTAVSDGDTIIFGQELPDDAPTVGGAEREGEQNPQRDEASGPTSGRPFRGRGAHMPARGQGRWGEGPVHVV